MVHLFVRKVVLMLEVLAKAKVGIFCLRSQCLHIRQIDP
jgi:hypothetical protein